MFHQTDQFHVSGHWNAGVWALLFSHKTSFFPFLFSFFLFFNLFFILSLDLVTGHDMPNYLEDQWCRPGLRSGSLRTKCRSDLSVVICLIVWRSLRSAVSAASLKKSALAVTGPIIMISLEAGETKELSRIETSCKRAVIWSPLLTDLVAGITGCLMDAICQFYRL